MKLYRVYHSYHDSASSGTNEYGIFSTPGVALARCVDTLKLLTLPSCHKDIEIKDTYAVLHGLNESTYVYHMLYELDEPLDVDCNGYT